MAILMNSINNNNSAYAVNMKLRNAIVNRLYETKIVINKVTIEVDDETGKETITQIKGLAGYSPVMEVFGLRRDYKAYSVTVEEEEDDFKATRKVNIDGTNYVYCDSVMTIECKDLERIKDLAQNGYVLTTEEGVAEYRVLGSSPSNEKHAVKYYYKVTDRITCEDDAYRAMDEIAGYAFSKGLFYEEVGGMKITKANTRWGNYLSCMQALGQIDLSKDCIAVVHKDKDAGLSGSIEGAHDFDEATLEAMKAAGIEIDANINDGADYFAAELVQEIGMNVNVKLTLNQAVKVALQNRPNVVTGKCMNRTVRQKTLRKLAKNTKAKFYGNTNGRLLMLIDEDGAKLINKQDLEAGTAVIDVYIMAMAKASTTKTSSQHLIKYMSVDEAATLDFIRKQTEEALNNYVQGQVEDALTGNATLMSRIIKALGDEAFEDKVVLESLMNDAFKYVKSAIAKNKLTIPGVYSHMMFDASYAFTNGAIDSILGITEDGFVEAYSEDVCRMYAKEIAAIEDNDELTEEEKDVALFNLLSGVVVKYPSAMPKEYEIIVYLTKKQMMNRIKNLQVSDLNNPDANLNDVKATLKEYVLDTPFGCTVYAPINAMKNKLAGADCDFDATMCDMSELKHILINARREENKTNPGFMGECTFISYKDINRDNLAVVEEEALDGAEDME